ncbi:hypothetical protein [Parabacteroides goldsteinii]|uniref:hypothetical protein n=1 Tax=Parabacteroides goldsteinii TaxID=328812 RepID=UPI003AB166BD
MGDCNNIFDRIQYIIDKEELNISSFSKEIGVVDQTVRNILKKRGSKPGFDVLSKIIQRFTWVDARWLMTGIQQETKETNKIIESAGFDESFYKQMVFSQQKTIENLSEIIRDAKKEIVPKDTLAICASAE